MVLGCVIFLFRREKIDLPMANAAPSASSTKETTNYARLCRLLVDIGTQALRDTLDAIHAPANLHTILAAKKKTLKSLKTKKVINPIQWGKLFPAISTSVSSRDFDITLLMILLRCLCGLTAPPTGWDALPAANDLRKEADIVRVKYFRNTVYGHAEKASVDDITFNDYWRDIRDTLVRLGGFTYEAAIDGLRNEIMDPEAKDHYVELLNQWKKDENNIKDQLDEMNKKLEFLTSKDIKDEGQPYQEHLQISCRFTTCQKCEARSRLLGNTDHSQSTATRQGFVEAEQGAEANFTDSGEQQFHNEQEQVTVTVSYQTRDKEMQVVDCKVRYKPKSVGRHNVEIKVNKWSLTSRLRKVEVEPYRYEVVRSSGSGELSGPYCIAKNEITGDIAVADYMNKRVQVFDRDMKLVKTIIGGEADSQRCAKIGCPVSVAFSKSNDLMITHEQYRSQNKKLSVITDRGLFIEHFTEHLIKAHHVSVKNDDGHVIVCDEGDRKIKEISSDGEELIQAFSAPDSKVLPSFPYYYRDRFFVSYMEAHCVKVFGKDGVFLYNIGSEGSGAGQLRYPEGLSIDSFGNLIVCDASGIGKDLRNGILKMFTLDGKFLTSFGNDKIKAPWIVYGCNNGDLLVADILGDSAYILGQPQDSKLTVAN